MDNDLSDFKNNDASAYPQACHIVPHVRISGISDVVCLMLCNIQILIRFAPTEHFNYITGKHKPYWLLCLNTIKLISVSISVPLSWFSDSGFQSDLIICCIHIEYNTGALEVSNTPIPLQQECVKNILRT